MSTTTHSPRRVMLAAVAVAREVLPLYAHPCSPKLYTQHQLFACLALKVFLFLDYRTTEQMLRDFPGIGEAVGMAGVPDHSTLHKAAKRFFGKAVSQRLLAVSVRRVMRRRRVVKRAAIDSSGFESGHRSPYFVRRRQRGQKGAQNPLYQTTTYTRFPKLTILVDCDNHLILAMKAGRGPTPDAPDLRPVLDRVPEHCVLLSLRADAGYDSEPNHRYARQEYGIKTLIPPEVGRPTTKPPSGHYRRLMKRTLYRQDSTYGQRWQSETGFSMIKRNVSCELSSRSYWAQCRELASWVVVHNLMLLAA